MPRKEVQRKSYKIKKTKLPPCINGQSKAVNHDWHLVTHSFGPLCNLSQTPLLDWVLLQTRGLSIQSVEKLVEDVLHPCFNIADLHNFNMRKALKDLDDDINGFKKESIDFRLPFPGHCFASEQHAPKYTVEGIPMRRLMDVIKDMCEDRSGPEIEWQPFE